MGVNLSSVPSLILMENYQPCSMICRQIIPLHKKLKTFTNSTWGNVRELADLFFTSLVEAEQTTSKPATSSKIDEQIT